MFVVKPLLVNLMLLARPGQDRQYTTLDIGDTIMAEAIKEKLHMGGEVSHSCVIIRCFIVDDDMFCVACYRRRQGNTRDVNKTRRILFLSPFNSLEGTADQVKRTHDCTREAAVPCFSRAFGELYILYGSSQERTHCSMVMSGRLVAVCTSVSFKIRTLWCVKPVS